MNTSLVMSGSKGTLNDNGKRNDGRLDKAGSVLGDRVGYAVGSGDQVSGHPPGPEPLNISIKRSRASNSMDKTESPNATAALPD